MFFLLLLNYFRLKGKCLSITGKKEALIQRLRCHDNEILIPLFTELAPENIYLVKSLAEKHFQGIVMLV
jgi:hypothetical protein